MQSATKENKWMRELPFREIIYTQLYVSREAGNNDDRNTIFFCLTTKAQNFIRINV